MALSEISLKPKKKGGGGLFGKILGGLAGLGAGAATVLSGGAAAPVIPAAVGAGSALGGAIGEGVDPTEIKGGRGVSSLENAAKADPGVQVAMISEGQNALRGLPNIPIEEREQGISQLEEAKQRINRLRGV